MSWGPPSLPTLPSHIPWAQLARQPVAMAAVSLGGEGETEWAGTWKWLSDCLCSFFLQAPRLFVGRVTTCSCR